MSSNYADIYNYQTLKGSLLGAITREIDKREGSLTADVISAVSLELDALYKHLDYIVKNSFADTANREYLIKKCAERGITPYSATSAIVRGEFNMQLDPGTKFTLIESSLNFFIGEHIETINGMYYYKLRSEYAGAYTSITSGKLVPVSTINGLTSARIVELLIPGENEESTESLRERYFKSFNAEAFGGNREDYITKINSMNGVGAVKAYRAITPGQVNITFLDSDYNAPSSTLVTDIQYKVDPTSLSGEGYGVAPIHHCVTVSGATPTTISVQIQLELESGYYFINLLPEIEAVIGNYLLSLRKQWEESDNLVVRTSKIEVALLSISGIRDVLSTKLNGLDGNIVLNKDSIPVLGVVSHV